MTTLDSTDIPELTKLLCIRDKDGRPALRVGLLATLFFTEPWTRPVREAVTDMAEEYIRQFREHLHWAHSRNRGHISAISKPHVLFPKDWLPQHQDGQHWSFGFHGGESANATSEFQVSACGSGDVCKDLGFLQFYLPLGWFSEHPEVTFSEYVMRFANRLRPVSGYAGIGVLEPYSFYAAEPYWVVVRQLAERFPGLEIEFRIGHSIYLREGIKGANWLTLLDDHWVQEIGGLDYLKIRLGEDFKITPYTGGVMIQAGPNPQIGDVTANRWPRHYVTLAKVLKPIQIKVHGAFHRGDPNGVEQRMDHEASLKWLFRFDGR
ncbi:MAG: type VI immunity family protein [Byssovorax sp.]